MDPGIALPITPFFVVRIRCRVFARKGSYRLARIAAKYGPEITLRDLLDRFSYDCLWRTQSRNKKGKTDCGVLTGRLRTRVVCGRSDARHKLEAQCDDAATVKARDDLFATSLYANVIDGEVD